MTLFQDNRLFKVLDQGKITDELNVNLVYGISFDVSRDLEVIKRNSYTVLDLLSDVGGIMGALMGIFDILVGLMKYNYLEDFLVAKLYKYSAPIPSQNEKNNNSLNNETISEQSMKSEAKDFKISEVCRLQLCFKDFYQWCNCFKRCLRPNQKKKYRYNQANF